MLGMMYEAEIFWQPKLGSPEDFLPDTDSLSCHPLNL